MDRSVIIKLVGILVVSFTLMVVVSFFLFPYLSSDTYDQIVQQHENELNGIVDSTAVSTDSLSSDSLIVAMDSLGIQPVDEIGDISVSEVSILKIEKVKLQTRVDSMNTVIYQLKKELEEKSRELAELESKATPEEFSVRIKSLLNLEVEEMSPILGKMTNRQIVKMYLNSGNTQREKILRSLSPDKAAQIISEVML